MTIRSLQKYKDAEEQETNRCYLDTLSDHLTEKNGRLVFKENHIISRGARIINTLKITLVDKIIEKLNERFPPNDSQIMYAMGGLGMKPVSSISRNDLSEWGNSKIETLIGHFGNDKPI